MSDRFMPYAATHTIIIKDGRVLLLRRFNTGWMDGLYTVPGGHIEANESAAAGAARELLEETGLSVDPQSLEHAITVHRKNEDGAVYFDEYFIAHEWNGKPSITEPHKSDAIEWVKIDELGDAVVPSILRALQNYQAGRRYAEDGWK